MVDRSTFEDDTRRGGRGGSHTLIFPALYTISFHRCHERRDVGTVVSIRSDFLLTVLLFLSRLRNNLRLSRILDHQIRIVIRVIKLQVELQ
jgi:hypothetical protein